MSDSTSPELGTHESDVAACLRDAVSSLGLGPDPSMNAAGTLARSERFWAAVEPLKCDLLEPVRRDMGGTDDAPETLLAVQEGFVEASLFCRSMFLRLVDSGGPVTAKGKTRALYTAYCAALETSYRDTVHARRRLRVLKLASMAAVRLVLVEPNDRGHARAETSPCDRIC